MAKPGLEGKRKPYTVTKKDTHTIWTEEDHQLFLQGMAQHCVDGKRNWRVISTQTFESRKSAAQIRSHAQKYFQKCEEEGDHCQIIQPRKKAKAKVRLVLPHACACCVTALMLTSTWFLLFSHVQHPYPTASIENKSKFKSKIEPLCADALVIPAAPVVAAAPDPPSPPRLSLTPALSIPDAYQMAVAAAKSASLAAEAALAAMAVATQKDPDTTTVPQDLALPIPLLASLFTMSPEDPAAPALWVARWRALPTIESRQVRNVLLRLDRGL
jgi:SHAQKYF class myb-like DNA-binding protein